MFFLLEITKIYGSRQPTRRLLARHLLVGDGAARSFAGSGVGLRLLPAYGKAQFMPDSPVAPNIDKALADKGRDGEAG